MNNPGTSNYGATIAADQIEVDGVPRPVLIDIAGERFTFAGDPKQLPSQEIGTR